jgi:hypothetical protein
MPKPDKALRSRPLEEVGAAVSKLRKVVLFHPDPIVLELPHKYCVCGKGERSSGKKSRDMVQCEECWEWFHFDCVDVKDHAEVENVDWKCDWCKSKIDKNGYQRWTAGRKKAKLRHQGDRPRVNGAVLGGYPPSRYSAPPSWDGKVAEVKELARRAAIKKRKLTEAVEQLVNEGGHHLVDAEGMAGLERRPVNDGMIDEALAANMVQVDDDDNLDEDQI